MDIHLHFLIGYKFKSCTVKYYVDAILRYLIKPATEVQVYGIPFFN
jgi:hypothetical protein